MDCMACNSSQWEIGFYRNLFSAQERNGGGFVSKPINVLKFWLRKVSELIGVKQPTLRSTLYDTRLMLINVDSFKTLIKCLCLCLCLRLCVCVCGTSLHMRICTLGVPSCMRVLSLNSRRGKKVALLSVAGITSPESLIDIQEYYLP